MISKYTHKNLTWIDMESPNGDEVRSIIDEFGIDPIAAEELLLPSLKSKVDLYHNFIYLILHFPAIKHSFNKEPLQEVDFIIGRDFIITTRYDTVDPIHKFSKIFEVNSILDRTNIGEHAGFIFFYMIRKLYRALLHELEYIDSLIQETEDKIFVGKEVDVVKDLSEISRKLLDFEKATSAHKDILESFEVAGERFFGNEFRYHLHAISSEYYKVSVEIHNQRESVRELRETNNSLLSTKQNEVMKIFTILAFFTFPLSLIAAIFGMNTVDIPIIGLPHDFWIVMGIIGFVSVVMFIFFRHRKWI